MTYSLQRLLIILGLVIIPFYEIFCHALPFVRCVAPDSRVTKEIIALVFALSIGLLAVWQGTLKTFRNKFFLIIPVYLLFNLIIAPYASLIINNNEVGDFYFWKPFAEVLCFTFMIIAVSSIETEWNSILKIMVICGTIMAGYVILQKFGFDQFWLPKTDGQFTSVRSHLLGGNLGQPTIVASWLVMMVPLAFFLKKYYSGLTIITACLFTQGAMVIGSLILIGAIFLYRIEKSFIILILILLAIGSLFIFTHQKQFISRMDGRYDVWKNTFRDIKYGQIDDNHKFSYTGIGFGRFSFTFPSKHPSSYQFMQAHNDPLEFIYNCGLIGGFLLLAGIFIMIKNVNMTTQVFSVLLSFIAILFCSLGTFPFQLGAHQFYASILVGLLHNEKLIRRV